MRQLAVNTEHMAQPQGCLMVTASQPPGFLDLKGPSGAPLTPVFFDQKSQHQDWGAR